MMSTFTLISLFLAVKCEANYAFNATPELALRSNRAIRPARVNAALELMRIPLYAVAVVVLASCVSVRLPAEDPWHPSSNGCFHKSIYETLMWGEEASLSSASFRFGVSPDTGQGPTVLVVLDSGKLINLGQEDDEPYVLGVVGTSEKTCVVRSSWTTCSVAGEVYETLQHASLPIGFGMSDPAEILVFHAPVYYLEYKDGQGNHNSWQFYGSNHPMQSTIDYAVESMKSCWVRAEALYTEF